MQTSLATFQPRMWILILQFVVLFAPSHLYPVEDQENEAVYRSSGGPRVPHLDDRNRYERPTHLVNDAALEQLLSEVEHARHRNRFDHGSPETVPDTESGSLFKCTGLTCLGEGTGTGDGSPSLHTLRGKRSERSNGGGSGTLDKLGGANLIRKRFFQTGSRSEPRLGATWHSNKGRDSVSINLSKRDLFGGFFTTPKPAFDFRVAKETPFSASSQTGLFKEYNSLLKITPAPPTQSSGLFGNFWGKRDGNSDQLGGASSVQRRSLDGRLFESLRSDTQENGLQGPEVEESLNFGRSRLHDKPNFDPEVFFDFVKGTVVDQEGDSVDFGFIHGEPYLKSSRFDAQDSPKISFAAENEDFFENSERADMQRRGTLDALGGNNLQKREQTLLKRYLDSLGGQNLQKREYLDALGGQNLQKRYLDSLGGQNLQKRYLDALGGQNLQKRHLDALGGQNLQKRHLDPLGGQNLQKRYLDALGGQNLQKRYLDSLGGQNLQKKSHLDSLGGQNLQKRDFFNFLGGSKASEEFVAPTNGTEGQISGRVDEIIYVSHSAKRDSGNETVPGIVSAVAKVEVIGEAGRVGEGKELFKVNFSESNEPKFIASSSSQNLDTLGGTNLIRNLDALENLKDSGREY